MGYEFLVVEVYVCEFAVMPDKIKVWIPACAGMTGNWIPAPACAGVTFLCGNDWKKDGVTENAGFW